MIIPIGQEESTVHRHPWVTYALLILCFVIFLLTHFPAATMQDQAFEQFEQAFEYYFSHPYLELTPQGKKLLFGGTPEDEAKVPLEMEALKEFIQKPDSVEELEAEQAALDNLLDGALATIQESPIYKFGLIAANKTIHGAFMHMFLHDGWIHLLSNMLFLFVCGPFVEDVWGRLLFVLFYISAGLFSGLAFTMHFPQSTIPLIGASGAIAGVMGAFALRHWKKKIRFFYIYTPSVHGTFGAPAWLMLPLWFLGELLSAHVTDALFPGGGGGGVAYWAHVWGFVFGVAVAFCLWKMDVEKKYIVPAIEKKETIYENPAIEKAHKALDDGRTDEAWELLVREEEKHPRDLEVALALWSLAMSSRRVKEAAPVVYKVIKEEVQKGDAGTAYIHWQELMQHQPEFKSDPLTLSRMLLGLIKEDLKIEANDVAGALADKLSPDMPPGVLIRLARLEYQPLRDSAILCALQNPEVPLQTRDELRTLLPAEELHHQTAPGDGAAKPVQEEPAGAPEKKARSLKLYQGIPLEIRQDLLVVDVYGQGRRSLQASMVKALSAATIRDQGGATVRLIDLWFDHPQDHTSYLRGMRFDLRRFDPQDLVSSGEIDQKLLFHQLVERLASVTRATLFPDPRAIVTGEFPSYSSIQEYEEALLRLG